MRLILLLLSWLLVAIGYNLTDWDRFAFMHRLSNIIKDSVIRHSDSYEECRKKLEVIGDTMFIVGIIFGLAVLAW